MNALKQTEFIQFQLLERSTEHQDALKRLRRMKAQPKKEVRNINPEGPTLLEKIRIVNCRRGARAMERWFIQEGAEKQQDVDKFSRQESFYKTESYSNFSPPPIGICSEDSPWTENSPWTDMSGSQNQIDTSAKEGATVAGILLAGTNPSWLEFESVLNQLDFGTGNFV